MESLALFPEALLHGPRRIHRETLGTSQRMGGSGFQKQRRESTYFQMLFTYLVCRIEANSHCIAECFGIEWGHFPPIPGCLAFLEHFPVDDVKR